MANMPKQFRMTKARRTFNAVIGEFLKYGFGPPEAHLLTTRGHKSGFLRTTPVSLVENEQGRFLVAPYGPVGWVRNLRADGFATLRRGGWIELVSVTEVSPERGSGVLREYVNHPRGAIVRDYFDVPPEAPIDDFIPEIATHPVFEIVRSTTIRL